MLAVERTVYLTIDDGPAGDFKQKVAYLNVLGIQAIWFCLGEALEDFAEEAILAIKAGHVIGNRSYDDADFSAISLQEAREQLERTDQIINELYAGAEVIRPCKAFRFPYMHHEVNDGHFADLQSMLEELGYRQPLFENVKDHEDRSQQGLHVTHTRDTFDLAALAAGDGTQSTPLAAGNEIIKIHDWLGSVPFTSLIDKLISRDVSFQLPQGMNAERMLTAAH
ncbi:hypothetical protein BK133_28765 [Paenibacillus sp. FSL H8-0548]|uniref:polysaccharide deacetylase family protein n=1 Tax=Paenibacillus sp. FSL H8-0548 TaxID=1920422 RepID=UPI00096FAE39|nr:polysaccharide deacetylase family protein [Paenibacillus sp. FSL H8-0548]OMF21172.1 hypothetical protein BK133_28765 [Paenibacillus sp. FSL H8-0548]